MRKKGPRDWRSTGVSQLEDTKGKKKRIIWCRSQSHRISFPSEQKELREIRTLNSHFLWIFRPWKFWEKPNQPLNSDSNKSSVVFFSGLMVPPSHGQDWPGPTHHRKLYLYTRAPGPVPLPPARELGPPDHRPPTHGRGHLHVPDFDLPAEGQGRLPRDTRYGKKLINTEMFSCTWIDLRLTSKVNIKRNSLRLCLFWSSEF